VLGQYQALARIETGVRFGAEINKRNVEATSSAFAPNPVEWRSSPESASLSLRAAVRHHAIKRIFAGNR